MDMLTSLPVDLLTAIIAITLLIIGGGLGFIGCWVYERISLRLTTRKTGVDPILGPKDRIAIYDRPISFVAMPEELRSREEMVEWLTKELPKAVSQSQPRA